MTYLPYREYSAFRILLHLLLVTMSLVQRSRSLTHLIHMKFSLYSYNEFYPQVNGITLAQSRQSLDMHSSITHDAPEALSRQKQRNVIGERQSPIINFYPSQIDSPLDLALLFRNVFFWQLASTVYPILSIMLLSASHVPSLKF